MENIYKIEKGIKIPSSPYPFEDMEVTDSFSFEEKIRTNISNAMRSFVKDHQPSWKFITRKMPDGTIRCWRTE